MADSNLEVRALEVILTGDDSDDDLNELRDKIRGALQRLNIARTSVLDDSSDAARREVLDAEESLAVLLDRFDADANTAADEPTVEAVAEAAAPAHEEPGFYDHSVNVRVKAAIMDWIFDNDLDASSPLVRSLQTHVRAALGEQPRS